jgi:GntR family transcriptional regulator, transcriptional repressor for pyruvate dehydrogenase complex
MESIRALGVASRQATGSRRAVREQSVRDHEAIVAALRARDAPGAADAMHRHLDNVERAGRSS